MKKSWDHYNSNKIKISIKGKCGYCGFKTEHPSWITCHSCDILRAENKKIKSKKYYEVKFIPKTFGQFNWDYRPKINYTEAKELSLYLESYIKENIKKCEFPITTYVVDNNGEIIGYRLLQ